MVGRSFHRRSYRIRNRLIFHLSGPIRLLPGVYLPKIRELLTNGISNMLIKIPDSYETRQIEVSFPVKPAPSKGVGRADSGLSDPVPESQSYP